MKVYPILFFVIAASLATARSTLASEGMETSDAQEPESSSATNLLRTRSTNDHDEDLKFKSTQFNRVIKFIKENFMPANPRDLLEPHDTPKVAFKKLELDKKEIFHDARIRKKEVVKFFTSRRFTAWSKHVKQYGGPNAYKNMVTCLIDIFLEKNFEKMIRQMLEDKTTRGLGKKFDAELSAMRSSKRDPVKATAVNQEP